MISWQMISFCTVMLIGEATGILNGKVALNEKEGVEACILGATIVEAMAPVGTSTEQLSPTMPQASVFSTNMRASPEASTV